jgi:hypothetical protein
VDEAQCITRRTSNPVSVSRRRNSEYLILQPRDRLDLDTGRRRNPPRETLAC